MDEMPSNKSMMTNRRRPTARVAEQKFGLANHALSLFPAAVAYLFRSATDSP
jgi:hypothetical protein